MVIVEYVMRQTGNVQTSEYFDSGAAVRLQRSMSSLARRFAS